MKENSWSEARHRNQADKTVKKAEMTKKAGCPTNFHRESVKENWKSRKSADEGKVVKWSLQRERERERPG